MSSDPSGSGIPVLVPAPCEEDQSKRRRIIGKSRPNAQTVEKQGGDSQPPASILVERRKIDATDALPTHDAGTEGSASISVLLGNHPTHDSTANEEKRLPETTATTEEDQERESSPHRPAVFYSRCVV